MGPMSNRKRRTSVLLVDVLLTPLRTESESLRQAVVGIKKIRKECGRGSSDTGAAALTEGPNKRAVKKEHSGITEILARRLGEEPRQMAK